MTIASTSRRTARTNGRSLASETLPFASYGRISKIKAGDGVGAHIGIARQHRENREVLAREFGDQVAIIEYSDNMSAWNPDVRRPEWERLLRDLADGRVRGSIAWHGDRYTRQPIQLEILLDTVKRAGGVLLTTRSGVINDPVMLRIEGALAAAESDQKSARITSKHREIAEQGGFHGGRRRYGFDKTMTTVIEAEATIIRECVDRVLAGETLTRIAADLRARKIPTVQGGIWQGPNLGQMLRRPHLTKLRGHRDPVTGEQTLTEATWPAEAIVDRDKWQRLEHLLADPSRRTSMSNARVYLLAGLATCATCGAPLRGRPGIKANPERRAYACETGRHCYAAVDKVDQIVSQRVVNHLERMTRAGLISPNDPAHAEAEQLAATIADLRAAADEMEAAHIAGQITAARFISVVGGLDQQRDQVERRLRELESQAARPADVLDTMTGPGAAEAWEAADLGRKRAIIDLVCTVSLAPVGRGRRFTPAHVLIDFRED